MTELLTVMMLTLLLLEHLRVYTLQKMQVVHGRMLLQDLKELQYTKFVNLGELGKKVTVVQEKFTLELMVEEFGVLLHT